MTENPAPPRSLPIADADEKLLGAARYPGDLTLPEMAHARMVVSPLPAARVVSVDRTAAEALPGVLAVLTLADLPTANKPARDRNSAILAGEQVVWQGQPVALVVAETEVLAADGARLVDIDYEAVPVVVDPLAAMEPSSPLVWEQGVEHGEGAATDVHAGGAAGGGEERESAGNVVTSVVFTRGDVEAGFAAADAVVQLGFRTDPVYQGYLEPHACVATTDPIDGTLIIYTSTQGLFSTRNSTARLLGLPRDRVRVVPMKIGGGFGAKYGIFEPLAGAAALAVGRSVRLVVPRSEDMLATTPGPGMVIEGRVGATRDGRLTALAGRIVIDTGAFASEHASLVANLLGGFYRFPHLSIEAFEVLTNKPMPGAYRAPGAPQATFAIESMIDELARRLDLDPLQFRLDNAVVEGDPLPDGDEWTHIGMRECLLAAAEHPLWRNRRDQRPGRGIGLAIGGWPGGTAPAAALCRADSDGTIYVHVGSLDLTGTHTSLAIIAAEIIGVSVDDVRIVSGDTASSLFSGPSGGSMVTYTVGNAVAEAAAKAKQQILEIAADMLEAAVDDLELEEGTVRVKGSPGAEISVRKVAAATARFAGEYPPITAEGRSAITDQAPGFAAHLIEVEVDPSTGEVSVLQDVVVQDVGKAINPSLVEGQMHGGALQGLGWALQEALTYDGDGQLLTGNLASYLLPDAAQGPPIEPVPIENPIPIGPLGARGVGEPPIVAAPAAVANAVRDATGVRFTELPLTPQRVWRGLSNG